MTQHIDRKRIAAAVRELLFAIGDDPDRRELAETPERVAGAYAEFFAGVGVDPLTAVSDRTVVGDDTGELVLVRDINFRSICEHHLLPFRGRAHVAYRPSTHVVGLGSIARLVEVVATRPQLQERLGEQIADALQAALSPEGSLVILEARHGCVSDRGSNQVDALITTIASRGQLTQPADRAEVMALITEPQTSNRRVEAAADRESRGPAA